MEASQRITQGQNVFGQRLTKFVQVSCDSLKVGLFAKYSASISLIAKTQREGGLVAKHSASISLIAKTQREGGLVAKHSASISLTTKTQREGRWPCCKTQRKHTPHCKNTLRA